MVGKPCFNIHRVSSPLICMLKRIMERGMSQTSLVPLGSATSKVMAMVSAFPDTETCRFLLSVTVVPNEKSTNPEICIRETEAQYQKDTNSWLFKGSRSGLYPIPASRKIP